MKYKNLQKTYIKYRWIEMICPDSLPVLKYDPVLRASLIAFFNAKKAEELIVKGGSPQAEGLFYMEERR